MKNKRKYTREVLEPIVKVSKSVTQVARALGAPLNGGCHAHLTKTIREFELDTSHFLGKASNKGRLFPTKRKPEEILIKGYEQRPHAKQIRRAMTESGVPYMCVSCKIGNEYNGKPLVIEIDHVNNDWSDNRLSNLQFLCPNCHSQKTATDGSKEKHSKRWKQDIKQIGPHDRI